GRKVALVESVDVAIDQAAPGRHDLVRRGDERRMLAGAVTEPEFELTRIERPARRSHVVEDHAAHIDARLAPTALVQPSHRPTAAKIIPLAVIAAGGSRFR